jgi:hypothetical protein
MTTLPKIKHIHPFIVRVILSLASASGAWQASMDHSGKLPNTLSELHKKCFMLK